MSSWRIERTGLTLICTGFRKWFDPRVWNRGWKSFGKMGSQNSCTENVRQMLARSNLFWRRQVRCKGQKSECTSPEKHTSLMLCVLKFFALISSCKRDGCVISQRKPAAQTQLNFLWKLLPPWKYLSSKRDRWILRTKEQILGFWMRECQNCSG